MAQTDLMMTDDEPFGHVVQLYGEDEGPLCRNVCQFLGAGLAGGDGVLVIADSAHRDAFVCQLAADGHDAMQAIRTGRLVLLDSEALLGRFMVDGQPDWRLFELAVGGAVRAIAERLGHSRLRAYGEMVGVLWRAGQRTADVLLEEYWNRLLEFGTIALFCGYPIDILGPGIDAATIEPLLCSHTRVVSHGGASLERALERAVTEVLGAADRPQAGPAATRAALPNAEATVLWIRRTLPDRADEILERARHYQNASLRAG